MSASDLRNLAAGTGLPMAFGAAPPLLKERISHAGL
jgi:hypothetical protein